MALPLMMFGKHPATTFSGPTQKLKKCNTFFSVMN